MISVVAEGRGGNLSGFERIADRGRSYRRYAYPPLRILRRWHVRNAGQAGSAGPVLEALVGAVFACLEIAWRAPSIEQRRPRQLPRKPPLGPRREASAEIHAVQFFPARKLTKNL